MDRLGRLVWVSVVAGSACITALVCVPPAFSNASKPLSLLRVRYSSRHGVIIAHSLLNARFLTGHETSLLNLLYRRYFYKAPCAKRQIILCRLFPICDSRAVTNLVCHAQGPFSWVTSLTTRAICVRQASANHA